MHEALEGGAHPCVALCDARIQGRLKGGGPEVWGGADIEGDIGLFRGAWSRQAVPGLRGWLEKGCPGRRSGFALVSFADRADRE